MNQPTKADLRKEIERLEKELADMRGADAPMPFRVRGYLKDIVRHPHRAVELAEAALERI